MYKYFFKNIIDFIGSFVLLLVVSPLLIVVTIALFFANNGKPFFIQERPGKNEKIFKIVKFKTMNDNKDIDGNLLSDKERLTKIGKFVRKTSLDELPQLFNIVKGDMSFLGPRPLLVKYLPYYNDFERKRHNVRPGITGLAQVNGRNLILWEDRIRLDVEYAENLTFLMDLKIIKKTIVNVLNSKDVAVVPSEMGRVTLDVRRDPKNKGIYDDNGIKIIKDDN
ncbi:sugar transferase [Flavobacterium soli]|uniref:sugar transferase n=1 Tax=Flavobacterium soli TaxID=344881 RepID=UPI0003F59754|nr:sugar transferase [Flavobacterium soli]